MQLDGASLLDDLFAAYRANLAAVAGARYPADVILCPLCLSEIGKEEVTGDGFPIEHIVPQHSTKEASQPTRLTKIGTKSARSGLTITCRKCNGEKGKRLDWVMRNRIVPSQREAGDYGFSSRVAILCYGYLLAFAHFGYEYALRDGLKEIRAQIADPSVPHTQWVSHARVDLSWRPGPIVCSEMGYPCVFRLDPPPLHVLFWRFEALLPGITGLKTAVDIPASVREVAEEANRTASSES